MGKIEEEVWLTAKTTKEYADALGDGYSRNAWVLESLNIDDSEAPVIVEVNGVPYMIDNIDVDQNDHGVNRIRLICYDN